MEILSINMKKIEKLFSKLNNHYFNAGLPAPVITISPDKTKGAYGWCSCKKIWKETSKNNAAYYEINICAEYLNRKFEEVVATLLHEMVHLYNLEHSIKDTSRNGTYHNKKFKETAEKCGLVIERDSKYGWTITTLNQDAKEFVKSLNMKNFSLYRQKDEKNKLQNQSSRKYVCPQCGCIIRATKEVHVMCIECQQPFQMEKPKN